MATVRPLNKPAGLQAQPAGAPSAPPPSAPAVVPKPSVTVANSPDARPPATNGNDLSPQAAPAEIKPQLSTFPGSGNIPGRDPGRVAKAAAALAKARAEAGVSAYDDLPPDAPPPENLQPPAPLPAQVAAPTVEPQAPASELAPAQAEPAPVESQAPTLPDNATPAQRNAWELISEAERRVAEERKKLQAERDSLNGRVTGFEGDVERLRRLEDALRTDPTQALANYGWSDERIAQVLVARHNGTEVAPPPQPQAPQSEPASDGELRAEVGQLRDALVTMHFQVAASGPEYDIVRGEPDGVHRAIKKAMEFQAATGTSLTPQQALSMVQDELVTEYKSLIAKRGSDPRWQTVLGSPGSPAPAAGGQPGTSAPSARTQGAQPEPQMTSITNDVAASAVTQPFLQGSTAQYEDARLERARRAIARSRG
jgi:hypothetical protein